MRDGGGSGDTAQETVDVVAPPARAARVNMVEAFTRRHSADGRYNIDGALEDWGGRVRSESPRRAAGGDRGAGAFAKGGAGADEVGPRLKGLRPLTNAVAAAVGGKTEVRE